MTEAVYLAIGQAVSGFVEAPAGCGKTEAIVRTVGQYCVGPQLVLTHTHAGVDALRRRFRAHNVSSEKFHVDTIAGWAWGWVRKYPVNGVYAGSTDIAVWSDVYGAMLNLLQKGFVRQGISNSYAGLIVDEYQDCTVPMHQMIVALKSLLPCRVLGDDLQGIFGFNEALIGWDVVKNEFQSDLGSLDTPHRWIKAGAEPLGRWLIGSRDAFKQGAEPDYRNGPIAMRTWKYGDVGRELLRYTERSEGRICVIRSKTRRLFPALETTLVNRGYTVLEANDLSDLRSLVEALADGASPAKAKATEDFLESAYSGLAAERQFIGKVLRGQHQNPQLADRKRICRAHTQGTTTDLIEDLLDYVEGRAEPTRKLRDSVSALKCILERKPKDGGEMKDLYASEIARRKHASRSKIYRSIGSTLLVKGLEYEHAIVLRDPNWQRSWGSHKDLYVALTRGAKTVTLVELSA